MKKLTFIVPTYNTEHFIEKNIEMWKELSKIVDIILVEDKLDKTANIVAKKIGARYYSKKNGNWGSVVNYVKKNKLIKTEYMAIVDPDDMIDLPDLKNLIINLVSNRDIYFTSSKWVDYISKDIIRSNNHIDSKAYFVHEVWLRTDIFMKFPRLPEGVPFTDKHFITYSIFYSNNFKDLLELSPYHYFLNIDGQSAADNFVFWNNNIKVSAIKEIVNIDRKYFINKDKKLGEMLLRIEKDTNYHLIGYIRLAYDSSKLTKEGKNILDSLYKEERKRIFIPFSKRLIWSKLYRIFTFKKMI